MNPPRFPRLSIFALAAILVLASCAAQTPDDDARVGDPGLQAGETPSPPESPRDGDVVATPPGEPSPAPAQTPRDGQDPPPAETPYADRGWVGQMAPTYLRAEPARRLVVEVRWVAGREPSRAALDHAAGILRREARKPDGIVFERAGEIPSRGGRYTVADLRAIEREHRSRRSSGSTATMLILYLDGEYEQRAALGVAYLASAAALFPDRMGSAATALVQPNAIERAVLTHEIGHLLGLVNLGYTSRHDHEDPDHPHHSRHRDSVMYWAVNDVSVAAILTGGPPSDFNRFDRDDLAFLRGG